MPASIRRKFRIRRILPDQDRPLLPRRPHVSIAPRIDSTRNANDQHTVRRLPASESNAQNAGDGIHSANAVPHGPSIGPKRTCCIYGVTETNLLV